MSESSKSEAGGCCGCISVVLMLVALWGLVFGVTIDGKHYGIATCDTKRGLVIDK